MSAWTERKIAHDLSAQEPIEPPEGLLEKIKSEIPPDLGSRLPAAALREARGAEVVPFPKRPRWLLAASLAAMMAGGLFAFGVVMRQMPADEMEEMAAKEEAAPAPASVAQPSGAAAPAPSKVESLARRSEADRVEPPAEPAPATQPTADQDRQQELSALGYLAGEAASDKKKEVAPSKEASGPPAVFQERRRDLADERMMKPQAAAAPAPPPPPPPPAPEPEAAQEVVAGVEGGVEGGVAGGAPGGVMSGVVGGTPSRAWSKDGVVITDKAALGSSPRDHEFTPPEPQEMTFKGEPPHSFVETAKDRLSTFGLDVDTASYTVARNYLRKGNLPPREAIRVEEFVNYFSYGDPPPARGDFALKAEGAASIFTQEPRTYLLRFNLRAREVKVEHRKPAVLTFVVDVSGSMKEENRLGLVKQSLAMLLDQLRKDDKVGLVVYGSDARVLLEPTSDRALARTAIGQLASEGATNAEAGIALGYDVASRNFRLGAINRILLCSDGVANVGATSPEAILQRIQREAKRGIELSTLGFGMGSYNDTLMEQLADKGDGRYAYLDDIDEAKKVLVEELTGTLLTIAEDAKVQVEFSPAAVARWRLIGYENRDIPDEKFRDNNVDAGEIGAGHSVTALYEVQLTPRAAGKIASLHLRYRVPVTGEVRETVHDLRVAELVSDWKNASPGFRLASLVVEFAETLRGSSHAEDHQKILRRAQRLVGEMADKPRGADVAEFARLVADAARIKAAAEKK